MKFVSSSSNDRSIWDYRRNRFRSRTLPWLRLTIVLTGILSYTVSGHTDIHDLVFIAVFIIYSGSQILFPKFRSLISRFFLMSVVIDQFMIFYACYFWGGLECPLVSFFYLPVLVYAATAYYRHLLFTMITTLLWLMLLGITTESNWISIIYPCITLTVFGFFLKTMMDQDFLQLVRHAMRDGLTDLYNYRYFYEQLNAMTEDTTATSISLIMIDLNEFKRLNDELGHLEGDRVLREVAGTIKGSVRSSDIVARYGGDEFAIILPGVGHELCEMKVEQIRQAIIGLGYFSDVAIGYCLFPDEAMTTHKLVELADRRMYEQKNSQKEHPPEEKAPEIMQTAHWLTDTRPANDPL